MIYKRLKHRQETNRNRKKMTNADSARKKKNSLKSNLKKTQGLDSQKTENNITEAIPATRIDCNFRTR